MAAKWQLLQINLGHYVTSLNVTERAPLGPAPLTLARGRNNTEPPAIFEKKRIKDDVASSQIWEESLGCQAGKKKLLL